MGYKRRWKIEIGSSRIFAIAAVSFIVAAMVAGWIFEGPIGGDVPPFYPGEGVAHPLVAVFFGYGTIVGYLLFFSIGYAFMMCLGPFLLTVGHLIRRFAVLLAWFWYMDYLLLLMPWRGAYGGTWEPFPATPFLFGTTIQPALHSVVNALIYATMTLAIYYPLKGLMFGWFGGKSRSTILKQRGQRNYMRWLGVLLGITGILALIGLVVFCPDATHAHLGHSGKEFIIVGALLMFFGAAVTYGLTKPIKEIENLRPLVNVGIGLLGGLLGIVGVADGLNRGWGGWGAHMIIIASLFAIFVSSWIYLKEKKTKIGRRFRRGKGGNPKVSACGNGTK